MEQQIPATPETEINWKTVNTSTSEAVVELMSDSADIKKVLNIDKKEIERLKKAKEKAIKSGKIVTKDESSN